MTIELHNEVNKCLPKIERRMTSGAIMEFVGTNKESLMTRHHTLDIYIRNYTLRPDKKLYKMFVAEGYNQKAKMAAIIMDALHDYLTARSKS